MVMVQYIYLQETIARTDHEELEESGTVVIQGSGNWILEFKIFSNPEKNDSFSVIGDFLFEEVTKFRTFEGSKTGHRRHGSG